jgi:alkylhydroperoxidase/carboxymuconolactone decarboxylase family protein
MRDGYYHPDGLKQFTEMGEEAPELWSKFCAWYSSVFADGALSQREKALIGLSVAHAVQCPYCSDAYRRSCLESGSNSEQMTEAVHCAAAPERQIVAVAGDGGLTQYMAEMTTAVKYGMNITVILVNNGDLGRVSSEQREERLTVWATELHNPDCARYADNCDAVGIRVTERSQLDDAIDRALAHSGPALVDVVSDSQIV